MDEVGVSFLRDRFDESVVSAGHVGKFVAVVVPEPIPLDPLKPGFHMRDEPPPERDRVFQHLLNAPVGIFGITVDGLPETRGDRWVDGVTHVVDWVLRLLPMDGPTQVRAQIEERGSHGAKKHDWRALGRLMLTKLTESNATRYEKLAFSINLAAKDDSPYLGYADAVAHTWSSSTAKDVRSRRSQSKLVGSCLHNGKGPQLIKAWDRLRAGDQLSGEDWRALVCDPDSNSPLGIPRLLLDQIAQACRSNAALWKRYFEATEAHLDSKAIDLSRLSREVNWLESSKPSSEDLPPPMRLAWLTADLQTKVHRGLVTDELLESTEDLSDELYLEFPRLVCQADLVRAVLMTNRFQFDWASRVLSRWLDKGKEVPGLQHWARVQSSLGQHQAFIGANDEAAHYFKRALDAFKGLSDKELAAREIAQTSTYRAIAAMDSGNTSPSQIRTLVSEVVSLEIKDIRTLAADSSPETKYRHHLLVRYLASHGTDEERVAYLEQWDAWDSDTGHPWQLIEAYRAIMVRSEEPDLAMSRMLSAHAIAFAAEEGPTMALIGRVLGAIAMGWGHDALFEERDLDGLQGELPAAKDRIEQIREAIEKPLPPPEALLEAVLPFNFR